MRMFLVYKKITTISVLFLSLILFSCASLEEIASVSDYEKPIVSVEKEQMLASAEELLKAEDYQKARPIYISLSKSGRGIDDPIYEKSLWGLSQIYDRTAEYEKAVLTLEELIEINDGQIPQHKINFFLLKNYFRISNYAQAQKIEKKIDLSFQKKEFTLLELSEDLVDITETLRIDSFKEDLVFLGTIQKYFLFIMESPLVPQNENLTERLISKYDYYFSILNQDTRSESFKKNLAIMIYDQLIKFGHYQLSIQDSKTQQVTRFVDYVDKQKKTLTERFYR